MCRRGASKVIISDQGTQLVAASKDVAANKKTGLNWEKIKSQTSLKGISWEFVPKEGQHANGLSESMVKKTKRSLGIIMGKAHFRYAELELACAEAAYAINNRPLGLLPDVTDDMLEPLTPNHLLLGTSGREIPPDEDQGKASRTKRYRYVQEVLQDWWVKWNELVFPTLVPSYKWLQRHRNVQKGDIVLVKYKNIGKGTFRMASVIETLRSEHDGLVRKVNLPYNSKGSKQWKELVRPIQSLAELVPVEE